MGQAKTVPLNGETITVRELTLEEINTLTKRPENESPIEAITALYETCTTAKIEKLMPLCPSELEPLVAAVVEVNSSFLSQAEKVNAEDVGDALKGMIQSLSLIAFLK